MASPPKDLWPDIIPEVGTTPFSILREQADSLKLKTKGTLHGRVDRSVSSGSGQFYLSFKIVVPNLDDYEYELFRVHHGVEMYPVTVDAAPREFGKAGKVPLAPRSLKSEQEFLAWLGDVLGSEHTKRVIGTLLDQSGLDVAS